MSRKWLLAAFCLFLAVIPVFFGPGARAQGPYGCTDAARLLPAGSHDCVFTGDGEAAEAEQIQDSTSGDAWQLPSRPDFDPTALDAIDGLEVLDQLPCEPLEIPANSLRPISFSRNPAGAIASTSGAQCGPNCFAANMLGRVFRDGVASLCQPPKPLPAVFEPSQAFGYHVYYFGNPSGEARCVTVDFATGPCGNRAHAAAFTNYWAVGGAPPTAFGNQPARDVRFLGDPGASMNRSFSFELPAGTFQWSLVVFDTAAATEAGNPACSYGPIRISSNPDCRLYVPPVDPNQQLGGQVHLPILNYQGQDEVCDTWIEAQYVGCEPAKAVLVVWGEPGFCPPQASGPLKVECTGLLRPGSTWNLLGGQIPAGAKSGMLFKFTSKQLGEVQDPRHPGQTYADSFGFDDIIADLMCETLFFGVIGDADDYRRFKKAYNECLEFGGINQCIAAGEGVLAVEVLRDCPADLTPRASVTSKYDGIAGQHLGASDPIFGGYGYFVPLIYAGKAGLNTIMYVQNGGLDCSSVEIWFKAQDDCLRAKICEIFALAPGESYQFDASDCVGPDWQGSAWLRASQPLGIAVDIFGRDILMTYVAEPQPFDYVMQMGDELRGYRLDAAEKVAFGPLIYSEYQGWDAGVQVMNLSPLYNAKVKVYFLDRSGDVINTLVDWICPRGSQSFFLPIVADMPGSWVGSVRVESQDFWQPGGEAIEAPDVVGVVSLIKYADVARTETAEAIAYNLLPEHKAFIWQVGAGDGSYPPDGPWEGQGGTYSGVGLIAIPSLLKDLGNTGVTSELAIMNLVAKPGFTDFAIYIYDQNGLLDFVCQKLHQQQVEYLDLQTWGYVNDGFKGSAIISATFWEHDVFSGSGRFVRNLVGLGAVSIERSGSRLGADIPGDEAAGARGIPFSAGDNARLRWCPGGFIPRCPGQPAWDPQP